MVLLIKTDYVGRIMLQKIVDFIAKLFGFRRKTEIKKKASTDDIYPMW
jgi:hypothetical protein